VGYQLKVSTDDVATRAATVRSQAAELESQVARLTSDMQALSETWTGTASSAFQGLYHSWTKQAGQIQAALEQIGASLRSAGVNYAEVEARNAASMK
jgi:early secretory antigenic target protein ESAT-6